MRPALEVADIFRHHGEAFRRGHDGHDGHLGRVERRVMAAIEACRTPVLGGHVEQCGDCGLVRCAYNSCRNRHCPKCQGMARAEWLEARQAELLPVPYFHVVFTLPPAAAEIAFQNKRAVYAILFQATAEALRTVAADSRHLGAEIGAIAVLHTPGSSPGAGSGDRRCSTIRTCTASFRAAVFRRTARGGWRAGPGSSCQCGCCRSASATCSWHGWRRHTRPANFASPAPLRRWPNPTPSQGASRPCAASTGWSMPSRHSLGRHRCSPISAATPTASPLATAG
jgi:hypothetical protein